MASILPRFNSTPLNNPGAIAPRASTPAPFNQNGLPLASATGQMTSDAAIINQALNLLGGLKNLPQDEAYMRHLGVPPIFRNGQEALQVIQKNGIQVAFGDMGDSKAHAEWMADQRLIIINAKYRGDHSPATLYAISEAIYHEAGHAAQIVANPLSGQRQNLSLAGVGLQRVGDDQSSIQEELECLALNTLAHRYHEAIDPAYAKASSDSPLLRDGVQLYSRLFFDPDPHKNALINRVMEKYGDLPLSSPGHEPPPPMKPIQPLPLAYRVIQKIQPKLPPAAPVPAMITATPSPTLPRLAYWA
jgi:hypothetical protein